MASNPAASWAILPKRMRIDSSFFCPKFASLPTQRFKSAGSFSLSRRRWGGGVISLSRRKMAVCLSSSSSAAPSTIPAALLFDCDGVLVDTEKDGHRVSFNDTFAEKELGVTWDVDLYGELLKIGGGKERMTAYFNKTSWPDKAPKTEQERKEFIASLHKRKTELFMALIEKKMLPLRPGVARLIDEALTKGVKVAVCSTSNEKAVSAIVSFLLGPERAKKIDIFAGDVVPRKKPDPAIYLLAASTLGVEPSRCGLHDLRSCRNHTVQSSCVTCLYANYITDIKIFLSPETDIYSSILHHLLLDFFSVYQKFPSCSISLAVTSLSTIHSGLFQNHAYVYILLRNKVHLINIPEPFSCVVVEDSAIGLAAAKAAGMKCIVTKSGYTAEEDFLTADAVFDCIGDPPEEHFDLAFCANLLQKQYVS